LQEIRDELGGKNSDLTGLSVQTDNGNEMLGRFQQELRKRNIKQTLGKPGSPASQTLVERLNQTIKNKLKRIWRAQGNQTKKPWDVLIAPVLRPRLLSTPAAAHCCSRNAASGPGDAGPDQ
jgi:transposase InsO family protein